MPMTVVITNNVPMKYRGFLASCMLELAPGVYSHPKMSAGIRQRMWSVMEKWYNEQEIGNSSIMLIWSDSSRSGGQGVECLGIPVRTVLDCDGILLSRLGDQETEQQKEQLRKIMDEKDEHSDK